VGRPTWQVVSNTQKSGAVAAGVAALGALFLWLTRGVAEGDSNGAAAMWLGVLLAAVGLAGLIFLEDVVVTVDPTRRSLRLEKRTRWGKTSTELLFRAVESVQVAKIGSRSDGTPSYWLQIQTRGGRVVSTGRWSLDQAEMERLAEQLAAEIGCAYQAGRAPAPTGTAHLAYAGAGAVLLYAAWYRVKIGPWCPAMWFGAAPALFVLVGFAGLLGLLRRFSR
jgi:hypothetical protein